MRGSRKFCQRGSNADNVFFSLIGGEISKYHYYRAFFGPPVKRHLNGVSLACRLWPKIESWFGSFTILRESGPVLLKKTIILWFSRGGPDPLSPSGSVHALHSPVSKVGLTSCWFSSVLVYAPLHHKWTYLCRMIPLLFAQLWITEFLLG